MNEMRLISAADFLNTAMFVEDTRNNEVSSQQTVAGAAAVAGAGAFAFGDYGQVERRLVHHHNPGHTTHALDAHYNLPSTSRSNKHI